MIGEGITFDPVPKFGGGSHSSQIVLIGSKVIFGAKVFLNILKVDKKHFVQQIESRYHYDG